MEQTIVPITTERAKDDPGPPRPAPLGVLAVLETILNPTSTEAAKADVLRQVREARERAQRERARALPAVSVQDVS